MMLKTKELKIKPYFCGLAFNSFNIFLQMYLHYIKSMLKSLMYFSFCYVYSDTYFTLGIDCIKFSEV